jgi:hypothetical protein
MDSCRTLLGLPRVPQTPQAHPGHDLRTVLGVSVLVPVSQSTTGGLAPCLVNRIDVHCRQKHTDTQHPLTQSHSE